MTSDTENTNSNDDVSKEDVEKTYVSYFQSVITIGILTKAKSIEEAERKATLARENNVAHFFEQTPMEMSDTEEQDDMV